jgi:hypothetical protein
MRRLATRIANFGVVGVILAAIVGVSAADCRPLEDKFPGVDLVVASKAAHKAADQFEERAEGSERLGHQVPRQTDAAVATQLDAVFNVAVAPLDHTPSSSETDALVDWQMSILRVGWRYIYAGTGVTDPRGGTDLSVVRQTQLNIIKFAPEVGRYFDAMLDISAISGKILISRPNHRPEDRSDFARGIILGAQGITSLMNNVLGAMKLQGLSDEWRRGRMGYLRALAPTATRMLAANQRRSVQQTASEVASVMNDPDLKNQLISFSNTMAVP